MGSMPPSCLTTSKYNSVTYLTQICLCDSSSIDSRKPLWTIAKMLYTASLLERDMRITRLWFLLLKAPMKAHSRYYKTTINFGSTSVSKEPRKAPQSRLSTYSMVCHYFGKRISPAMPPSSYSHAPTMMLQPSRGRKGCSKSCLRHSMVSAESNTKLLF